jgi:hypothetical protein
MLGRKALTRSSSRTSVATVALSRRRSSTKNPSGRWSPRTVSIVTIRNRPVRRANATESVRTASASGTRGHSACIWARAAERPEHAQISVVASRPRARVTYVIEIGLMPDAKFCRGLEEVEVSIPTCVPNACQSISTLPTSSRWTLRTEASPEPQRRYRGDAGGGGHYRIGATSESSCEKTLNCPTVPNASFCSGCTNQLRAERANNSSIADDCYSRMPMLRIFHMNRRFGSPARYTCAVKLCRRLSTKTCRPPTLERTPTPTAPLNPSSRGGSPQ